MIVDLLACCSKSCWSSSFISLCIIVVGDTCGLVVHRFRTMRHTSDRLLLLEAARERGLHR
jgi:hypothetical protein